MVCRDVRELTSSGTGAYRFWNELPVSVYNWGNTTSQSEVSRLGAPCHGSLCAGQKRTAPGRETARTPARSFLPTRPAPASSALPW